MAAQRGRHAAPARLQLSDIRAVGNPIANLLAGNELGTSNGGGFGWRDVTVVKIGAAYDLTHDWTIRGGYSHVTQPIPPSQTFFNILAPGVVRNHYSLGGSYRTAGGGEWSLAYMYAPKVTVSGSGSIPGSFGGGEATLHMREQMLSVGYSWAL